MRKRIFRIEGSFKQGLWKQKFRKEIIGFSERQVLEKVLSDIGSKHGVKRCMIKIEKIEEISPEEVRDQRIKLMLGG
ncbi:MAG: 50S ribosomal protein L18Ae [Candidatus Hadarchaeales archaeon]